MMSHATDTPQEHRLDTISSWGMPRRRYVESTGERSDCTTEISVRIATSDPWIPAGLAAVLRKRRDFRVLPPEPEGSAARRTTSHPPSADVVVADYDSALRLAEAEPGLTGRVVILTHNDSEAKICHALERGARGYLLLGCSLRDLLGGIRSVHSGGVAVGALVAPRIAAQTHQEALTGRVEGPRRQMMVGLSNKKIAQKLPGPEGHAKTKATS